MSKKAELDPNKKTAFQDFEIRILESRKDGKLVRTPEKLRLKRNRVLITPQQAAILNQGVVSGHNTTTVGHSMYYLEGEDMPYSLPDRA